MQIDKNKKIERLFERGNYDSKNITNKSDIIIKDSDLDILESEGSTFELLKTLGVPVFKYRTQITIHGLFSELQSKYHFGYKNIFQNKNLSIGVKYTAVDRVKKQKIYHILCDLYDWQLINNSSEYLVVKYSKRFNTKNEYLELLPEAQKYIESINKDLFFGQMGVTLIPLMFGGYCLMTYINLGCLPADNVNKLIENLTGCSVEQNEIKLTQKDIDYKLKMDVYFAELKKEKELKEEIKKPFYDQAKNHLISLGYEYLNKYPIYNGLIVVNVSVDIPYNETDYKIDYRCYKYTIEGKQKDFREYSTFVKDFNNITFPSYCDKTIKKVITGWIIKPIEQPIKEVKTEVIKTDLQTSTKTENNIKVVDYTDKSFAVIGETKPIKDILKQLGGSFNFRLTCGCGWIFPISKKQIVLNKLNLA